MADNVNVTNRKSSFDADSNSDIAVRTSELSSGKHVGHIRIDKGSGDNESVVTNANPLPVTDEDGATEATLSSVLTALGSILTELGQKTEPANSQTVAGTVTANLGALNGAATAANQVLGSSATDGWEVSRAISVTTAGIVGKASAAKFGGWAYIFNANSSTVYLKLYNKATAPTSADTSLLVMTIPIPPGSPANVCFGKEGVNGFTDGFSYRASAGLADNNNTSITANTLTVNLLYK